MDWFLYDNGLRHERVKRSTESNIILMLVLPQKHHVKSKTEDSCIHFMKKYQKLQSFSLFPTFYVLSGYLISNQSTCKT